MLVSYLKVSFLLSLLALVTGCAPFVHYDPRWGDFVNKYRNQFVQTIDYKLYQDGSFYNLEEDLLEQNPIKDSILTKQEIQIKEKLVDELNKHPIFN